MPYMMNLGCWQSVFAVPSDIVDKHLRLAGESSIKALLYILRNAGRELCADDIANAVGIPADEVSDAVGYWVDAEVICETEGIISPSPRKEAQPLDTPAAEYAADIAVDVPSEPIAPEILTASVCDTPAPPETSEEAPSPAPKKRDKVRYSYDECVGFMSDDADLRQMLIILEGLMQKQLNHTEISVFITLSKWYGLPPRCVAMLVEYCHSIGKHSIAYIESTGIGWAGEEINSIERANAKISRLRSLHSSWNTVRNALDIPERKATKREEEYCDAWINQQHHSVEMIKLAFDRCVDKKGKMSMNYMNGILDNWFKKGIKTPEQAENESKPAPENASGTAGSGGRYSPTYDKAEIEDMLFSDLIDEN
ncbi:MAG: DnaD domain protein [Clostridia bacterium]|nr:DnaD domain protein [Clostridia bacterium]